MQSAFQNAIDRQDPKSHSNPFLPSTYLNTALNKDALWLVCRYASSLDNIRLSSS
jgi:hypothetical protein